MRPPSSSAVIALALIFLADPRTAGAALLDPTRPLVGGREDASATKSQEAAAIAAALPMEAASAPAAPPALQSLQVPRQGEATAIVDGQLLKVGGKLGSYEVTHIDAHGLMVRGPSGRERWTLAGVEVLDSRQPAASLKMGPLDEARKPARRPGAANAGLPLPPLTPQGSGAAAPSPLVFPLPVPQGQTAPTPGSLPPRQPTDQPLPPSNPARPPAVKQALADTSTWSGMSPMTVALQPTLLPQPRPSVRSKRAAVAAKAWTVSTPSKPLRMDLDDMRRIVQIVPVSGQPTMAVSPASRWQHPVNPHPYGAWVAAWATGPSPVRRPAFAPAATGLMLARWLPPQPSQRPQANRLPARSYTPVSGPRPIPASVVWRPTVVTKAWQPQGVNDLPGAHSSQWASRATPVLRIAALEPQAVMPRTFAQAAAKPAPRTWSGKRWPQARPTVMAKAVPPVTHSYPMALSQWRSAPTAQADNSFLTQVAFAPETP
jgi:hypothetical protein